MIAPSGDSPMPHILVSDSDDSTNKGLTFEVEFPTGIQAIHYNNGARDTSVTSEEKFGPPQADDLTRAEYWAL